MSPSGEITRRTLLEGAAALTAAPLRLGRSGSGHGFEVWLVRHGESQINVAPAPPGQASGPLRDDGVRFPLTLTGIRQVKTLSARLTDLNPAAIIASARLRAIQTADAISLAVEVPVQPSLEIVEVDVGDLASGAANGFQEVYRGWLAEDQLDTRSGTGESRREVEARALPFMRGKIEEYRSSGRPLLFVTHGALISLVAPRLFDNIPRTFGLAHPVANAGIIRAVPRGDGLHCIHWSGQDL